MKWCLALVFALVTLLPGNLAQQESRLFPHYDLVDEEEMKVAAADTDESPMKRSFPKFPRDMQRWYYYANLKKKSDDEVKKNNDVSRLAMRILKRAPMFQHPVLLSSYYN